MATKISITLDAAAYRQQLAQIVADTRKAAEVMAAAGNTQQTVKVTADTAPAERALSDLSDRSDRSDVTINVSADTAPAEKAVANLPQAEDQTYAITGTVNAPDVPQTQDQEYTITGSVSAPDVPQAQDQQFTVSADTAPAERALSDLSDLSDRSGRSDRPDITISVSADTAEAEISINEIPQAPDQVITVSANTSPAADAIKSLGGTGQSIWAKLGSQFKQGASAITAIGAAAGASVPAVGMLGTVINAALSPIALIAGALTALVAVGSHVWDKLTVSAAEYAAQAKLVSEEADREVAKFKEQDSAAGSYLSRLKELSSAEQTGNAAKAETASLLETLQNSYGDLGAKIDETTGKITNMSEVEERLNARRAKRAAAKQFAVADAAMTEAKAAYMKSASGWFDGKTEAEAGRSFDQMQKNMTPAQLLKYFETMAKNAKTEADIQNYSEVASKLRKAAEAREKAQNILGTGQESGLAAEQAAAKKAQAATAAKQARDTAARQFAERESDDEFAQEKDIDKKKANRQARIDAEKKNEARYQKELDAARDTLARIQKDKGKPGYDAGAEADAAKAVADAERKVQESQAKQYSFKNQIQQIDKQRSETAKKMTDQAAFELEYNRLIAAGEYDKAAALKLEHELKQQNLKLTEKEKQAILDNQKAQKALNLQVSNRDKARDLQWQMMEKAGLGREAAKQRALLDAEKTKGGKLTDSERESVGKLAELTWKMANLPQMQMGDLSIKTNSLTARGGFQGGAVMPDKDQVNRAISMSVKQTYERLGEIKSYLYDLNSSLRDSAKVNLGR